MCGAEFRAVRIDNLVVSLCVELVEYSQDETVPRKIPHGGGQSIQSIQRDSNRSNLASQLQSYSPPLLYPPTAQISYRSLYLVLD